MRLAVICTRDISDPTVTKYIHSRIKSITACAHESVLRALRDIVIIRGIELFAIPVTDTDAVIKASEQLIEAADEIIVFRNEDETLLRAVIDHARKSKKHLTLVI